MLETPRNLDDFYWEISYTYINNVETALNLPLMFPVTAENFETLQKGI
jgi:hypothetical protein